MGSMTIFCFICIFIQWLVLQTLEKFIYELLRVYRRKAVCKVLGI